MELKAFFLFFITIIVIMILYIILKGEHKKYQSIKEILERQGIWSSPIFFNIFFCFFFLSLGAFFTFIGLSEDDYSILWFTIPLFLFGLLSVLTQKAIWITNESISFQPVLFKLLNLTYFKKVIYYKDIQEISMTRIRGGIEGAVGTVGTMLKIYLKNSEIYKLAVAPFNPEVGFKVYQFLKEKIKQD